MRALILTASAALCISLAGCDSSDDLSNASPPSNQVSNTSQPQSCDDPRTDAVEACE